MKLSRENAQQGEPGRYLFESQSKSLLVSEVVRSAEVHSVELKGRGRVIESGREGFEVECYF
jgi:hypothetical protein